MTRFKELARIQTAIKRKDESELQWQIGTAACAIEVN
jgi:hypothetical protein